MSIGDICHTGNHTDRQIQLQNKDTSDEREMTRNILGVKYSTSQYQVCKVLTWSICINVQLKETLSSYSSSFEDWCKVQLGK